MKSLKKIILVSIASLMLTSCAAAPWKHAGVAPEKRSWRFCTEEYDGDKAGKGFCYIDKECRRQFIFKKCRPKPLFCAWGDIPCMTKYKVYPNMIIRNR